MATVPPEYTKTGREYQFYVPKNPWGQAFELMVLDLEQYKPIEQGWHHHQKV